MNSSERLKLDCRIRKAQRKNEKIKQKADVAMVKKLKRNRVKKFTDELKMIYINPAGAFHCCKVRRDKNRIFIVFSDGELRKNYLLGDFYYRYRAE